MGRYSDTPGPLHGDPPPGVTGPSLLPLLLLVPRHGEGDAPLLFGFQFSQTALLVEAALGLLLAALQLLLLALTLFLAAALVEATLGLLLAALTLFLAVALVEAGLGLLLAGLVDGGPDLAGLDVVVLVDPLPQVPVGEAVELQQLPPAPADGVEHPPVPRPRLPGLPTVPAVPGRA